jgi:hypothetical protein
MDAQTKIQLSPFEMDLLNNPGWILTKNLVIKKAHRLLEEVQQTVADLAANYEPIIPQEVLAISPKISKGENYLGLPWLMLDFPRFFGKDNTFAIRTMFWWGHSFSSTLHLSGNYKQRFSDCIAASYADLCHNEFYVCVHSEQWHHHFENENYLPVSDFTASAFASILDKRSFLKISARTPFSQWDNAATLLSENFMKIAGWLR